ncbi:amidase [Spirosoma telluris]|uniref:amidase n=1 Tax=Spirosoma telluris TaxID=2183553 RepID=UPI002FC3AE59
MKNPLHPLLLSLLFLVNVVSAQSFKPKQLREATIEQLHSAMQSGKLTAAQLVQLYLDRIEAYDKQGPFLNTIIMVNPKAMAEASRLDSLYKVTGKFVGPLHGIPVIVKDNYNTFDMPTTNGTLAMKKNIPPKDAFVIQRIREAGAIIIAKSNLAEFATSGNVSVSSILPGYSRNPYDTKRTTAGSSGGTAAAVAADFGTIGLGTDTGSSIRGHRRTRVWLVLDPRWAL